jgi:hypothetical protein
MYPDHVTKWDASPEVKGIELWSDWNVQSYEWGTRHADGRTADYLTLHTEDLVGEHTKAATIKAVAAFVGSSLTDGQLCELVNAPAKFMGSHSKGIARGATGGKAVSTLKGQYGKWEAKLAGKDALRADLMAVGGPGLARFRYSGDEARPPPAGAGLQCASPAPPVPVADSADCKFEPPDVDYKGADLRMGHAADALACCGLCRTDAQCTHFTYVATQQCYLKSGTGTRGAGAGLVSGHPV